MSLTANSSVESARVKFLMNSTYIMSRKLESLSTRDVRRVHQKCYSRRFDTVIGCLDSFWLPEPKNVSFLLPRHDVRRVHEKFSSSNILA